LPPLRPDPFRSPQRWSPTALLASAAIHALFVLAWVYGPRPVPPAPERALLRPPTVSAPIVIDLPAYRPEPLARAAPDRAARPRAPERRPRPAIAASTADSAAGAPPRSTPEIVIRPDTGVPAAAARGVLGRIAPSYATGRLWQRALPLPPKDIAERMTGKGRKQLIDSVVHVAVAEFLDSLANDPYARPPTTPSWTTDVAGKKFGLDSKWVYVAGLKIPTAVLALLPLPRSGSLDKQKAWQQMMDMRADIQQSAQRAANSEDVKQAIRDIRQRKEEEEAFRRNRETPPDPVPPPTAATPPGEPATP
jgi:hypothetical protein